MGTVYRAWDRNAARAVALKRLSVTSEQQRQTVMTLFEREYHTLAQLSHPSVIEVFDYGLDEDGPFYTMELLEGSDLRTRAAIPTSELCGIVFDAASALSLLHARRLVHRDVTTSNIRVVAPGRAKLIDFGALTAMGTSRQVVGTPAYVAPEALLMQPLDGRSDLYSLGVVLYRALTGRYPYRARNMSALRDAWRFAPPSPRELSGEVPPRLSDLTMSLIALNRESRPRDAAEVMERLSVIGKLDRSDCSETSRAYLVTPSLVGRREALRRSRDLLVGAMQGRGGALLYTGLPGVGRTRVLDAAILEAKVLGLTVIRLEARDRQLDFAAIHEGCRQLRAGREQNPARAPRSGLYESPQAESAAGPPRPRVISDIRSEFSLATRAKPVAIFVDDVHWLDEPSVAALASLAEDARSHRLCVIGTIGDVSLAESSLSLRLLVERSDRHALRPLDVKALQALFHSMFGDVPNLNAFAERIHHFSHGLPRDAMAVVEHLLDRGTIGYRAGAFSLPEAFGAEDLPSTVSDALEARARRLSPLALEIAQAQALSSRDDLSLEECQRLVPGATAADVFRALDELTAADLFRVEGPIYLLRHDGWRAALASTCTEEERAERHRAIARALGDRDVLARAFHSMHAGEPTAAEMVVRYVTDVAHTGIEILGTTRLSAGDLGWLLSAALRAIEATGAPDVRTLGRLRYFMMILGVFVDARWFFESAPEVERGLLRDAGYYFWESADAHTESMPRLFGALQRAQAAFDAASGEHQYPPAHAIRHLVQYVVAAIAVGARAQDGELRRRLPALLAPFAPLSPVVEAMKENSQSAAESTCADYESAAARLEPVVEALSKPDAASIEHAAEIRAACIYAIGAYRARIGIAEASRWLDQVADHPRHASNVQRTRALLALHRGDWTLAREHLRAAEQYDMEHDVPQLFGRASIIGEIEVYARGLDMSALNQLIAAIEAVAARYGGWRPHLDCARAEYERLRGNHTAALTLFDRAVLASVPERAGEHPDAAWYPAETGALETLIELGRLEECRARAEKSLASADGTATGARYDGVQRALALCEARQGDYDAASRRIVSLIEHRRRIGSSGLGLGLLYEARTLIELWRHDLAAARGFFELARAELGGVEQSGFAPRLEDLRRRLGDGDADCEDTSPRAVERAGTSVEAAVSQALSRCADPSTRAYEGLALLCSTAEAIEGHLYLVRPSGVTLAASTPAHAPPPGLEDYLKTRLDFELGEATSTVATALHTVTMELDAASLFSPFESNTEGAPRLFHPVWVRANLGAHSSVVGVAALGFSSSTPPPPAAHVVANALGDYLVRSGGTRSSEADSISES